MPHPYLTLISSEVTRAEADLTGFRSRALTVVTTSAGVVTLLTGLVTFAASRTEDEVGLDSASVVLVGIALAGFVVAGVLALMANLPKNIERPATDSLKESTAAQRWDDGEPESEHERVVADVLVSYLGTLRTAGDATARLLSGAIACQIFGVAFAAASVVVTMSQL